MSDERFEVVGAVLKLKADQSLRLNEESQVGLDVTAIDAGKLAMDPPKHFVFTVTPIPFPWHRPFDHPDVKDNGFVSPIDALLIINELNERTITDAMGALPKARPANVRIFYDVNGNDFVSPIDALLVINYLNRGDGGEGEMATLELVAQPMLITPGMLSYLRPRGVVKPVQDRRSLRVGNASMVPPSQHLAPLGKESGAQPVAADTWERLDHGWILEDLELTLDAIVNDRNADRIDDEDWEELLSVRKKFPPRLQAPSDPMTRK